MKGCSKCSARFQTVLVKMGFILCHDQGYALPIEGMPCTASPYLISWETIKSDHSRGVFVALAMFAKWKSMNSATKERLIHQWRVDHIQANRATYAKLYGERRGEGAGGLRGFVVPLEGAADE